MNPRHQIQLGAGKRVAGSLLGWMASALASYHRLQHRLRPVPETLVILILEPYGMGDVIALEPLIRLLRQQNVEVRLSAKADWRPLYPPSVISAWLDAVVPWNSYDSKKKYGWASLTNPAFREYICNLRRLGRGAIGLDPRGDIRSVMLLHLAGCRKVLSLDSYLGSGSRVPTAAACLAPFRDELRRWELNVQFLPLVCGIPATLSTPPRFAHFQQAPRMAGSRRVGLVPVAPWSGKLWSPDNWGELIRWFTAEGWVVRGLCGPKQVEAATRELNHGARVDECIDVQAWANNLTTLDCVVSVDSGPMHLADALGIPVVALFGQGKLPLWAPSGPRSRVVSHQTDPDFLLCHPIDANTHLGKKFMDRIAVQEVVTALREIAPQPDDRGGGSVDPG